MRHIVLNNVILPFAAADVRDGEAETIEVDEKLGAAMAKAAEIGGLVSADGTVIDDIAQVSKIRESLAEAFRETPYFKRKNEETRKES